MLYAPGLVRVAGEMRAPNHDGMTQRQANRRKPANRDRKPAMPSVEPRVDRALACLRRAANVGRRAI